MPSAGRNDADESNDSKFKIERYMSHKADTIFYTDLVLHLSMFYHSRTDKKILRILPESLIHLDIEEYLRIIHAVN